MELKINKDRQNSEGYLIEDVLSKSKDSIPVCFESTSNGAILILKNKDTLSIFFTKEELQFIANFLNTIVELNKNNHEQTNKANKR